MERKEVTELIVEKVVKLMNNEELYQTEVIVNDNINNRKYNVHLGMYSVEVDIDKIDNDLEQESSNDKNKKIIEINKKDHGRKKD